MMSVDWTSIEYQNCHEERCRDMFQEFVYIVVLPGALLLTFVMIMFVLMYCHTCRREKKEAVMDNTQLLRYNSIRRASLNLRHLSHNRDTQLLSTRAERDARVVSLNLDNNQGQHRTLTGTASAPSTLQRERHQRHQQDRHSYVNPPQYRLPPSYSQDKETNQESGIQHTEIRPEIPASAFPQNY